MRFGRDADGRSDVRERPRDRYDRPQQAVPRRCAGGRPGRPARRARRDLRVPRAQRCRQVDDDPDAARDDPTDGGACRAVRRTGAAVEPRTCGGASVTSSSRRPPTRNSPFERTSTSPVAWPGCQTRPRWIESSSGWHSSPTRIGEPARFRSATCNGWPLPVRCCRRRSCSSSMSQPTGWIRPASSRSASCSAASRRRGRHGLHVQPHPR